MWGRSWNESKSEAVSCCSRRAQRLLAPRRGCSTSQTLPHRSHLKNTRDPVRTVARTSSGSAWQLRQKGFGCRVRDRRSSAIGEGITWWSRACRNSRGISSRLSMRTRFEIRGTPRERPHGGSAHVWERARTDGIPVGRCEGRILLRREDVSVSYLPATALCHAFGIRRNGEPPTTGNGCTRTGRRRPIISCGCG